MSQAGYLHIGEPRRKAGERAMADIGKKFTAMYLGKENVPHVDKSILNDKACQMATDGDLVQAKASEAKAKGGKAKKK